MTDENLARQAAEGSPDAFWELYRRHRTAVFNLTLRILRDAGLAEDAAHESFLAAYEHIGRYDEHRGKFMSWLLAIAHHECCRVRRRRRWLVFMGGGDEEGAADMAVSGAVAPQRGLGADESVDLERALARLPEKFRSPILLTKLHGLSVAECGAVLGISATNVKQRVFRGFQLLRLLYGSVEPRAAGRRAASGPAGGFDR